MHIPHDVGHGSENFFLWPSRDWLVKKIQKVRFAHIYIRETHFLNFVQASRKHEMYVSCIYIYAKRIFSRGDTLKKHQKVRFAYIYMREMNFLMIFWEDTLFQFGLTLHPFSIWCLASPDVRSGKIVYKSVLQNPFLDQFQWVFFKVLFGEDGCDDGAEKEHPNH